MLTFISTELCVQLQIWIVHHPALRNVFLNRCAA